MKFVYLLLACLGVVAILILYFQLIAGGPIVTIVFFNDDLSLTAFSLYLMIISFLTGIFTTLGFTWFLSSWENLDDDFNV